MGFEPLLPWWIVVAAAVLGSADYVIRRDWSRESAARAAALFFLAWLGLNPVRRRPERVMRRPTAFVAVDSSRSMAEKDEDAGSRWKAAIDGLRASRAVVEGLKETCRLTTLSFDGSVAEGVRTGPDGLRTDIRGVIARARELAGLDCAGLVVFSDGRHNSPGDPADEAAVAGFPVHCVALGKERGRFATDVAVKDLKAPESVVAGEEVRVEVLLSGALPAPAEVVAVLLVDGSPRGRRTVRLRSGRDMQPASFTFEADSPGLKRVDVRLKGLPDDSNPLNDSRATLVRVEEKRPRVVLLGGAASWDYKFLRRALSRCRAIELVEFPAFLRGGDVSFSGAAAVIVAGLFGDAGLVARVARFVDEGGSAAVLASAGALSEMDFLPVVPAGKAQGTFGLKLTPSGHSSEICRLVRDEHESAWLWTELELDECVEATLKPAATALVLSGGRPLLAWQPYGRGRVAAFLSGRSWRWCLRGPREKETYVAFWERVARWLGSARAVEERGLWVETERRRCRAGDEVTVSCHLRGYPGARVLLEAEGRLVEVGRGDGFHTGRLKLTSAGEAAITAEAYAGGECVARAETRVLVEAVDVESEDRSADRALLRRVSEASGGKLFSASGAESALKRLVPRNKRRARIVYNREELVWRGWIICAMSCALAAEWALRRRRGLP